MGKELLKKKILYFIIVKYKFNSESYINFSISILKVINFIKNTPLSKACLFGKNTK